MDDSSSVDQEIKIAMGKAANKNQIHVPDAVVFMQPTSSAALSTSIQSAGLEQQDIYKPLKISASVWTGIINGKNNFPNDKLKEFTKLVNNDIYIRWLGNQCSVDIKARKSTLEDELEAANRKNEQLEHDLQLVKELLLK